MNLGLLIQLGQQFVVAAEHRRVVQPTASLGVLLQDRGFLCRIAQLAGRQRRLHQVGKQAPPLRILLPKRNQRGHGFLVSLTTPVEVNQLLPVPPVHGFILVAAAGQSPGSRLHH